MILNIHELKFQQFDINGMLKSFKNANFWRYDFKIFIARISLIMGNLSSAGVNLLESIDIAKSVSNNDVLL